MEMLVLGPVRVLSAGKPLPLAPKVRALMALLAVHANRTVSIDRLVDGLWGEEPPPSAAKTLQTYVFLMRRHLTSDTADSGAGLRIVTEGQGYRLEVAAEALDARRFEDLQRQAWAEVEADPRAAATHLAEALALWRGPPFADFAYEPWAEAEIERLEELRATAFEQLAQARLLLGEHEQIVGDLRHAVAELPFREQLWADLMLALYRSGRRAEALLAFREAEDALRKELGADPGTELQELAARIRDGDPSLARPTSGGPVSARHAIPGGAIDGPEDQSRAATDVSASRAEGPSHRATNRRSLAVLGVLGAALVLVLAASSLRLFDVGARAEPTLTAAEEGLHGRLPISIRDSCLPNVGEAPPLGLSAGFRCEFVRGSPANYVEYWQFTTPEQFEIAINSLIQQQQIPNGSCARESRAFGPWNVGGLHAGRMLCHPTTDGHWVVWTYDEDRIVGRAFRNDDAWQELYVWAKQLALFLRSG